MKLQKLQFAGGIQLQGKDVSKMVNSELNMSAPIDVYKETELASLLTKSYCVSQPENMNNKNSVCKLVFTFPKNIYLSEKNALDMNLRF